MDPILLFIATIIELIAKYGIPATVKIIQEWAIDEEPTLDDIKKLKLLVPRPETYFENKQ